MVTCIWKKPLANGLRRLLACFVLALLLGWGIPAAEAVASAASGGNPDILPLSGLADNSREITASAQSDNGTDGNKPRRDKLETPPVPYEMMVVAKQDGVMLALYNTLTEPVDKDKLRSLARYCYDRVGGGNYKRVLVNWYLPGQLKGDKPWAVSNFTRDMTVIEILDESRNEQFQSAKRWQQPGHEPLIP